MLVWRVVSVSDDVGVLGRVAEAVGLWVRVGVSERVGASESERVDSSDDEMLPERVKHASVA